MTLPESSGFLPQAQSTHNNLLPPAQIVRRAPSPLDEPQRAGEAKPRETRTIRNRQDRFRQQKEGGNGQSRVLLSNSKQDRTANKEKAAVVESSEGFRDGFASLDQAARLFWGSGRSSAQPHELKTSRGQGFVVAIKSSAHQQHKTHRYGTNAFSAESPHEPWIPAAPEAGGTRRK